MAERADDVIDQLLGVLSYRIIACHRTPSSLLSLLIINTALTSVHHWQTDNSLKPCDHTDLGGIVYMFCSAALTAVVTKPSISEMAILNSPMENRNAAPFIRVRLFYSCTVEC